MAVKTPVQIDNHGVRINCEMYSNGAGARNLLVLAAGVARVGGRTALDKLKSTAELLVSDKLDVLALGLPEQEGSEGRRKDLTIQFHADTIDAAAMQYIEYEQLFVLGRSMGAMAAKLAVHQGATFNALIEVCPGAYGIETCNTPYGDEGESTWAQVAKAEDASGEALEFYEKLTRLSPLPDNTFLIVSLNDGVVPQKIIDGQLAVHEEMASSIYIGNHPHIEMLEAEESNKELGGRIKQFLAL